MPNTGGSTTLQPACSTSSATHRVRRSSSVPPMAHPVPRRANTLGLFGLFDVDAIDVQLRVRIARHELARRRPDLAVRLFAPFGASRPIPVAADLPLEPITPLTAERRAAIVAECAA